MTEMFQWKKTGTEYQENSTVEFFHLIAYVCFSAVSTFQFSNSQ